MKSSSAGVEIASDLPSLEWLQPSKTPKGEAEIFGCQTTETIYTLVN